jgi:hypothetical protein
MADLFNLDAEILADQENQDHPQDTDQQQEQEEQGEEWNNDDQQDAEQVEVVPEDTTATAFTGTSTTQSQSNLHPYRVDLEDIAATATTQDLDYTQLYSFWRQETQSPELLPFPTDLVDRIKEGIIATATDDADPIHTGNQGLDALLTSLVTIDTDRVTFLLADLLKRRLQKIEAHPLSYMETQQDSMSPDEVSTAYRRSRMYTSPSFFIYFNSSASLVLSCPTINYIAILLGGVSRSGPTASVPDRHATLSHAR